MPKVKLPRKSTSIDMTAMCDVSFLLLTFFMLTSNFTQKEPVLVATPSSISEIKIPEANIMTIIIDKDGKVFFGIDGQEHRIEMLNTLATAKGLTFTEEEKKKFSLINSFGVPLENLKTFLAMKAEDRDRKENQLGIPTDSLNNQFGDWVKVGRMANREIRIAIKGDRQTPYKVIKNVMTTMQKMNENRYNLITSLETVSDDKKKK